MTYDNLDVIECSRKGCPSTIKNDYWSKVKADDWFFQQNGDAWCPNHHPEWVAAWRAKKAKKK